jgi:hypothetical protein
MTGISPIGRTGTLLGLSRFATSRRSTTDLNPIHRFERVFDPTFDRSALSGEERLGATWHAVREAPDATGAGRKACANKLPGLCRPTESGEHARVEPKSTPGHDARIHRRAPTPARPLGPW